MKLLLDSSAIIEFLRGNQKVREVMGNADSLYTSPICTYEVLVGEKYNELRGIGSSYQRALGIFAKTKMLHLTSSNARSAAEITARLMLNGTKVNDLDVLIASQALSIGAVVLTTNVKHFEAIKEITDLPIEKILMH